MASNLGSWAEHVRERASQWLALLTLLPACGNPSEAPAARYYVGLIHGTSPDIDCPAGPNRELVSFGIDDDDATNCNASSGFNGEPPWLSPFAEKPAIVWPTPPKTCTGRRDSFTFRTCRTAIEGTALRPLTTDPDDEANFYAVLQYGPSCPPLSTRVGKFIKNDTHDNTNFRLGADAAPSVSMGRDAGDATLLFFCFFRAAPSQAETMATFPDLGFPYAVFHDFDSAQPDWVLAKRWFFSDDSNTGGNVYEFVQSDDHIEAQFLKLIEAPERDGTYDTFFDIARVR